jgi:hypothetical protein
LERTSERWIATSISLGLQFPAAGILPAEPGDWRALAPYFDRSTFLVNLVDFVLAAIDQRLLFPDNGLCRGQS